MKQGSALLALAGVAALPIMGPEAPRIRAGGGPAAAGQQAVIIGAVLPLSGSPSRQEYARLFLEGAELAAAQARAEGVRVELAVRDNTGTPSGSARAASALEAAGAVAILGPLADENVEAAVAARSDGLPLLSPTATRVPAGQPVYSMATADPRAGEALARALARLGHVSGVVLRPRTAAASLEASAFERVFADERGIVTRTLVYQPGATTFGAELTQVRAIMPRLLVVLAPAADLQLLAPQIGFYGLDTLDIQVAGTAGWTNPAVLASVARRHTDYVIAASSRPPDAPPAAHAPPAGDSLPGAVDSAAGVPDEGVSVIVGPTQDPPAASDPDSGDAAAIPAFEFLVAAYEAHFRRSLTSPLPAVGYDLVRMVLEACGRDRCRPHHVAQAMEQLTDFEGATGTWSSSEGRLVREHIAVEIYDGRLHPVGAAPRPGPP